MSYQSWKEGTLSIADMNLDQKNPRMPSPTFTERELIAEYIKYYKVYDLAKSIAENGYFPNERLIVIKEDGKHIVVEGNRRLAALKSLSELEVVPDENKDKFRKLPTIDANIIKNIPIVFAPTREDANQIIVHLHTVSLALSWEPITQARFYDSLISQGETIDEISSTYHMPRGVITDFIKTIEMYSVAKCMELPEDIQTKVSDEKRFPISTLMDRIIGNPKVRKSLGIDFDGDGRLNGKIAKEEFEKGYKKIITDLAKGDIDSRSSELLADNIGDYLKSFEESTPDTSKKGSFDRSSFTDEKRDVKKTPTKTKQQKSRRTPKALIPEGIAFKLDNTSLQNIYNELRQKIVVKRTPHATAILFRSFLQMSLVQYLKEKKLLGKVKKRDTRRQPTLDELLTYFISGESPIKDDAIKQAIQKSKSERDKIFSVDSMNVITHNEQITISEDNVRQIWANFEGLMNIILSGGKK